MSSLSPFRIACASLIAAFLAARGFRKGSLSGSGAVAALAVGTLIMGTDWAAGAALIFFYMSGTAATRFGASKKAAIDGETRDGGGRRDWVQVLATAGVSAILSIVMLLLQFGVLSDRSFAPSSLALGSVPPALLATSIASFACACGDTWASEFGILSTEQPIMIVSCRRVPRGTNGGVTVWGTALSVVGGAAVGAVAAVVSAIVGTDGSAWNLVVVGAAAGGAGSLIDSILGATIQRTWLHVSSGRITSHLPQGAILAASRNGASSTNAPATNVYAVVSGLPLLTNEGVNFASALLVAAATFYVYLT